LCSRAVEPARTPWHPSWPAHQLPREGTDRLRLVDHLKEAPCGEVRVEDDIAGQDRPGIRRPEVPVYSHGPWPSSWRSIVEFAFALAPGEIRQIRSPPDPSRPSTRRQLAYCSRPDRDRDPAIRRALGIVRAMSAMVTVPAWHCPFAGAPPVFDCEEDGERPHCPGERVGGTCRCGVGHLPSPSVTKARSLA
jgi:hypothetical protein